MSDLNAALAAALKRAEHGLDWSRPCLLWVGDFVRDATGRDPAAAWQGTDWNEATAKRELAKLALLGEGPNAVSRAMDAVAKQNGWIEVDAQMQGATLIGIYDGRDGEGYPAVFDGQDRWIISVTGVGWSITASRPARIWEVPVSSAGIVFRSSSEC